MPRLFGLIGYPLSHSFSKRCFTEKFRKENIGDCAYELFPLPGIELLPELIAEHPELEGLNVTIPYKQSVIPFLNSIDPGAQAVGAVNTIRIQDYKLSGFNTDVHGFRKSLEHVLTLAGATPRGAMVLGTGGAAKAVVWVLRHMQIPYIIVSRNEGTGNITYNHITRNTMQQFPLIINTTPAGMAPHTAHCPPIPYAYLSQENILFDLVYNPEQTLFLERGKQMGCYTANGLEMLYLQAEAAWTIWNS